MDADLLRESRVLLTTLIRSGVLKTDKDNLVWLEQTMAADCTWFYEEGDADLPGMVLLLQFTDEKSARDAAPPEKQIGFEFRLKDGNVTNLTIVAGTKGDPLQWWTWITAFNRKRGFTAELLGLTDD